MALLPYSTRYILEAMDEAYLRWNDAIVDQDSRVARRATMFVNTPPSNPMDGDCLVVGSTPTGIFVGHENDILCFNQPHWFYRTPEDGEILFDTITALQYQFDTIFSWNVIGSGEYRTDLLLADDFIAGVTGSPTKGTMVFSNFTTSYWVLPTASITELNSLHPVPKHLKPSEVKVRVYLIGTTTEAAKTIVLKAGIARIGLIGDMDDVVFTEVSFVSEKHGNLGPSLWTTNVYRTFIATFTDLVLLTTDSIVFNIKREASGDDYGGDLKLIAAQIEYPTRTNLNFSGERLATEGGDDLVAEDGKLLILG